MQNGFKKGFKIKTDLTGLFEKFNRRSVLLALFVVTAFGIGLAATTSGFSFFGPAKTRVIVFVGEKKYDFFSTKKTFGEALSERGIKLFPQDKSSLSLNTELTGKAVKGAIDKSMPITIFDGYKKISGRSTSNDSAKILSDNNVATAPEDRISTDLIFDPVETGAVGLAVRIDRAPKYYVSVDDRQILVRSWDPGVAKILTISKVKVNPQDEIAPQKTQNLLPGETVVVTRINEVDVDVVQSVSFEVENKTSSTVPFGTSRVTQDGSNGQVKKTYHVVYKNGVEVSRWLTSSSVVKPVQNKIVSRGMITGRANFGYYSGMVTSFYKGYTGRSLLVTNLANGKQVTVKIIGSGPFNGPLMDMGTEPFKAIGGTLSAGYLPNVSVVLLD